MTDNNAALANDTALPKTSRHYKFGTFSERLAHLCALFEIDPPEIVCEDGEPTLTDGFMDWIKANEINMDWLFVGSPCGMLRQWTKAQKQEGEFLETAIDQAYKLGSLLQILALAVDGQQVTGKTFEISGGGSVLDMAADMAGEIIEGLEIGQKTPSITSNVSSV